MLVRVRAASVNAADWHIVRGRPFVMRFVVGLRRPKSPVPGKNVAGEVEAVGANVTQHRSGDQSNVDMVRSIGADHVFDYTREDVTRGGTRYDVIFQLGVSARRRLSAERSPPGGCSC